MKKLIEFFAARSFLVNLISILVFAAGVVSVFTLRRDLVPPMDFKVIQVSTIWPGATALQVEKYVTVPFETAFKGLDGVTKVSSDSSGGSSLITLELADEHKDVMGTLEEVRDAADQARAEFPLGVRVPSIRKGYSNPAWLATIAIKGIDPAKTTDRAYVRRTMDELLGVDGVALTVSDLPGLELHVKLDPRKLESLGVSGNDVRATILRTLGTHPVGNIDVAGDDISLGFASELTSVKGIENAVLRASRSGYVARVRDVARLEYQLSEDSRIRLYNGSPYVEVDIFKDKYGDLIKAHAAYTSKLTELKAGVPQGIELVELDSGSNYLGQQMSTLSNDAIIGTVLVLLVLGYFLGWRAAAAAAFGVPIAYLGTFIAMQALGISLDLISIIAMILIIGVLVDDAIIVTEAYVERLNRGMSRHEAAVSASVAMIAPVTTAMFTAIIAFLPILFAGGELKEIFFSIPIVIISAFLVGWLECFFILPNHLEHFVTNLNEPRKIMVVMKQLYEKTLRPFVRFRYATLTVVLCAFGVVGYLGYKHLQTSFSLQVGAPRIAVEIELKDSASPEDTLAQIRPVIDWADAKVGPTIQHVYTSISKVWMDGKYREGARFASIRLVLDGNLSRAESVAKDLENTYQAELDKIKPAGFERLTVGVRRPQTDQEKEHVLTLSLSGKEAIPVSALVEEIEASLKDVPGLISVNSDEKLIKTQWSFQPNDSALERFGFSPAELAQQIQDLLDQQELADVEIDGEAVSLRTSLVSNKGDLSFKKLGSLTVLSPAQVRIPLSALGSWSEEHAISRWLREKGQRHIELQAKFDPEKTNPDAFKKAVEARASLVQKRYPSYTLKTELLSEQEKKNRDWIYRTLTYCLVGIIFVLAVQFQSATQPALVALAIPFGFFGALVAYLLHGEVLNLMGMLGLLGVAGVSVNDAIVMTDTINDLEREEPGRAYYEALIHGGVGRLQAMMLNAVTTLVGLFPMAYSWGGESGFTKPIAFTMAWGLTSSFLLTLYVLPAILMVRKDVFAVLGHTHRRVSSWRFGRKRLTQSVPAPLEESADEDRSVARE